MAWQGIEGHDAIAARFAVAEAAGRVAGSYLFVGQPGVGKATFARALALALACEHPAEGLTACRQCASCIQALAGTHPDIDIVEKPPERTTIPLDALIGSPDQRLRTGFCWRLLLRPALARRKVSILLDADHLSDEAANCLLKTLEEPPPGAVIILVGTTLERQLPTIRSRCQTVRFGPLAPETIAAILAHEQSTTADEPGVTDLSGIAQAAGGSLQRARLLLNDDVAAFRDRLLTLLAGQPLPGVDLSRETLAVVEAAGKEAPLRRARLRIILEQAVEFFRASLRQAAGGSLPADPTMAAAVQHRQLPGEDADTCLRHTLDALTGIERNANLGILIDAWSAKLEPQPSRS